MASYEKIHHPAPDFSMMARIDKWGDELDPLCGEFEWPLPNVWLGTSVEDQETASERIPHLIKTPAAIRFLSIEPLLAPIDITKYLKPINESGFEDHGGPFSGRDKIDWIIVGGESGPKARPMHPDWVRTIRDQCQEANVPFFFKQWGEYLSFEWINDTILKCADGTSAHDDVTASIHLDEIVYSRLGKKKAGNLLDGKKHEQFPKECKDETTSRLSINQKTK